MPSLERRRLRRRMSLAVPAIAVTGVLAFFVIGGIVKVNGASGPYRGSITGSFAQQTAVLADRSNETAAELGALLGSLGSPSLQRAELQHALDAMAAAARSQADLADLLTTPAPSSGAAQVLAAAMDDRATATVELRQAIDGLLGMQPVDLAGAPSGSSGRTPVPISADQAIVEVQQAGDVVARSDERFADVSSLVHQALPRVSASRSDWLHTIGPWTQGTSAAWIGQLTRSAPLRPVHLVTLLRFRLDPALFPALSGSVPVAAPPTSTLVVTVVVANTGNVPAPGVVVEASTTQSGVSPAAVGTTAGGDTNAAGELAKATVSVAPGRSAVVALAPLRVHPGTTYILTVSVVPPAPQTGSASVQQTVTVADAPPAPPTTTTTVPRTTTTTGPKGATTTRPIPTTAATARTTTTHPRATTTTTGFRTTTTR